MAFNGLSLVPYPAFCKTGSRDRYILVSGFCKNGLRRLGLIVVALKDIPTPITPTIPDSEFRAPDPGIRVPGSELRVPTPVSTLGIRHIRPNTICMGIGYS